MRYPTHLHTIETALSPPVSLMDKVLDLSGNTFSASGMSYNVITTKEININTPGSCTIQSSIRVNDFKSTEMKKSNETFSYTSATIKDIVTTRDQVGNQLKIYNNPIEFMNPSLNIPGSSITTIAGKVTGIINTTASINTIETEILSMVGGTSPNWICTVNNIAGFQVGRDVQVYGVNASLDVLVSPFNTDSVITATIQAIVAPNTIWIAYSGTGSSNPPGPPTPVITAFSKLVQSSLTITNAYIQMDELRISITGGYATPDLSGANPPTLAASTADSIYFAFISRYTNNIGYSNTLYDVVVGHTLVNGTVDWIHHINGLVTTKEEQTPVLLVDPDNELYLTYVTTGATSGNSNGINIYQNISQFGICGCQSPSSCTDCGLEDVVLARINVVGVTPSNPPIVVWKIQNGYINSIYRETKPVITLDNTNKLVYLAYECNKNLACFRTTGSPNILLHCFTKQGNHLWVQAESQINSPGSNTSPSIAADNQGNVYLAYEITAQVEGGAPVPVGEKQIEVVRFQTILSQPNASNTYNPSATYTYGNWVYYPPTSSWYQVRALSVTNIPPGSTSSVTPSPVSTTTNTTVDSFACPSSNPLGLTFCGCIVPNLDDTSNKWSEPYSANVQSTGRVWVLSERINIFTQNGILGDDSSKPLIVADSANGYVFLTFLTTGQVVSDPSISLHDVVAVAFSKDRVVRWIKQGGSMFNPNEITYVECDCPNFIMDRYGNLTLSLLTYVRRIIAPPEDEEGEPVTEIVLNVAVFNFDQNGDTRWSFPRTETEQYPVYMFSRTDGPNAVFPDTPVGSFSCLAIGRSANNIFLGTISDLVAPGQTQVGTPGVTKMLIISIYKEDVYYLDRNAFYYMTISRSSCACGKENCGCN
jgi:hypothetical protein